MTAVHIHGPQTHPALSTFRLALRQAMADAGQLPAWTETYAVEFDAPLLLLSDGRIVLTLNRQDDTPDPARLVDLLQARTRSGWRPRVARTGQLSVRFLSALLIAFFPKCPFCWAAYMSYVGATGVVSASYQPWLIWPLIGLLAINVGVLYRTRHRNGSGPFRLCLAGALFVVINRLWVAEPALLWLGAGCLLTGSLWNSLSPKMIDTIRYYAGQIRIVSR